MRAQIHTTCAVCTFCGATITGSGTTLSVAKNVCRENMRQHKAAEHRPVPPRREYSRQSAQDMIDEHMMSRPWTPFACGTLPLVLTVIGILVLTYIPVAYLMRQWWLVGQALGFVR